MNREQLSNIQEECWDLSQEIKSKANGIPSFIQNDLQMMIDDGMVTEEEVTSTLTEMESVIESTKDKLDSLKNKVKPIRIHYERKTGHSEGEVSIDDLFPLSQKKKLISLGHETVPQVGLVFTVKSIDTSSGQIRCIEEGTGEEYLGFFDTDTLIIRGKWKVQ